MAYAPISAATLGDNTVVAAKAGKKIQVERFILVSASAVNVKWRSGTTDLTGLMTMGGTGFFGLVVPGFGSEYWLDTAAGEALVLNLSGAVATGGVVVYELG